MRYALLLLVALLCSGCIFHVRGSRNALGITDVERPPPSLVKPAPPEDPGLRGIALYGNIHTGLVGHTHEVGGVVGGELGFFPFTLERSTKSWVADEPMRGFGGAVGWSIYRGSQRAGGESFGPLYVEGRVIVPFGRSGLGSSRFGLGGAFNPQTLGAGPQATACIGVHPAFFYFCTRGAWMFGKDATPAGLPSDSWGGPEIYAYFEFASFLEYAWSR